MTETPSQAPASSEISRNQVAPVILVAVAVIAVCILLVLVGLILAFRWGNLPVQFPLLPAHSTNAPPVGRVVRHFVARVNVAIASGVVAGVLVAGAGGRLVMRLLALTSGAEAKGRLTEAGEVVGRISVGGTIAFIIFTAVFIGGGTGAVYMVLHRWLPTGRVGGVLFGALLLVLASTRIEPLRQENPDFDLVGPGWVSVVAFSALVILHGMLVAALAGRFAQSLPPWDLRSRATLAYVPLLVAALFPLLVVALAVVCGLLVLVARSRPQFVFANSRLVDVTGRVAIAVIAIGALPGFIVAVRDIVGSS